MSANSEHCVQPGPLASAWDDFAAQFRQLAVFADDDALIAQTRLRGLRDERSQHEEEARALAHDLSVCRGELSAAQEEIVYLRSAAARLDADVRTATLLLEQEMNKHALTMREEAAQYAALKAQCAKTQSDAADVLLRIKANDEESVKFRHALQEELLSTRSNLQAARAVVAKQAAQLSDGDKRWQAAQTQLVNEMTRSRQLQARVDVLERDKEVLHENNGKLLEQVKAAAQRPPSPTKRRAPVVVPLTAAADRPQRRQSLAPGGGGGASSNNKH